MDLRQVRLVRRAVVATLALALTAGLVGCAPEPDVPTASPSGAPAVEVRQLQDHTTTLTAADPAELALDASRLVFERAPVVVLASFGDEAAAPVLSAVATALDAPVLWADGPADRSVQSEAERLGARGAVVVEDDRLPVDGDATPSAATAAADAAGLKVVHLDPDAAVTDGPDGAPVMEHAALEDLRHALGDTLPTTPATRLTEVLALVDPTDGQEAALATLRAAGAVTEVVPGGDLGATAASVRTVNDAQALTVVGVGPGFADADAFAWQVAAAETGQVLPNGTQRLAGATFAATAARVSDAPQQMLAATDDDPPSAPADPAASTTLPTLVLRASARVREAGTDRTYLRPETVETLTPLVEAARRKGLYVVLELEGGSATLLDQVRALDPLLSTGGVGVLVHPEQRRSGAGRERGGAVTVAELQEVVDHLAALTADHALPQVLLAVHSLGTAVEGGDALAARPQVAVVDSGVLEGL
ncbi:hypothetical protein [Xylanimonas protaetiae]|uniref:Cell wall-binding repeat-containing protein n=1 Tax=Xylanimonas protaetiae TaxID=2509457 RepID=A0A4P6F0U7_9MICO|nr:hypothetical protein [Xylanimonas protaetiae]QAY69064.1 hypothetical protein ET471_02565 [Xylanimonas protaetiae]